MKKKNKSEASLRGEENPVRALGLHIAGLRAGILDHKPQPDSPAQRVADLLGEAAYILLNPPTKNDPSQK